MSAIPGPFITPEEYLKRERAAEFKSEYYRGEVFAMPGASRHHCRVSINLIGQLYNLLKDSGCHQFANNMRVGVGSEGLYTYPDLVIVCDAPEFRDNESDTLLNPKVIVEILSKSTEGYDRGLKFQIYQSLPSLREYVLISQEQLRVERYVRGDDDTWSIRIFSDPSSHLRFDSIDIAVPLGEIYAGVTFPDKPKGTLGA